MAAAKRQRAYTVEEKLRVVERLNNGETQANTSRELGIAASTLRGWAKNEAKLQEFVQSVDIEAGLERKRMRLSAKPDIEKALHTWATQERAKGTPLNGPILQAQASKFGTLMGDETFQASKGYVSRFKNRHSMSQVTISGESRSADDAAANAFPAKLKDLIERENYVEEQIYNCDETALFAKLLPEKTLAFKYETQKTSGFKKLKDRVTLLFCTNRTGTHKLTPLLIGRFNNPRCFKHLNKEKLPVLYASSKNAWMNRTIFEDWFHKSFVPAIRKHLRKKNLETKALLLLDNCPAHPPSEFLVSRDGKIRVHYLPINTTSKIQPLDQGIIKNFKTNYRTDLVSKMISCESENVYDFLKALNIKEIIYLVTSAWENVKEKSIANCWTKGLGSAFSVDASNSEDVTDIYSEPEFDGFSDEDILVPTQKQTKDDKATIIFQMLKDFKVETSLETITGWLDLEEECSTVEFLTEEEIAGCVGGSVAEDSENLGEITADDDDDDDDDDVDSVEYVDLSHAAVLKGAQALALYMEKHEADYVKLLQLRGMIDFVRSTRAKCQKQNKITSYMRRTSPPSPTSTDEPNFI